MRPEKALKNEMRKKYNFCGFKAFRVFERHKLLQQELYFRTRFLRRTGLGHSVSVSLTEFLRSTAYPIAAVRPVRFELP